MENAPPHSYQPPTYSESPAGLRVTNPSLPSPDPNRESRDTKRAKNQQEKYAAFESISRNGQSRFRPPGYTSAAPWLAEGDFPASRRVETSLQAKPTIFLPNPHSRPLARSQEDDSSAEGVIPYTTERRGPGVRLAVVRPLRLTKRHSSAPSSIGENGGREYYGQPIQPVFMDRRRTSEISRFELLERPPHPREPAPPVPPIPSNISLNYDSGRRYMNNHREMRQTQSHSSSVFAHPSRPSLHDYPPLRQRSLYQQRQQGIALPEVAISESSLIIGGEDIYADLREDAGSAQPPYPLPPRPPAPIVQKAPMHTGTSHSARRRPPLHLGVQGLSYIEEDRESTFRPAGYAYNTRFQNPQNRPQRNFAAARWQIPLQSESYASSLRGGYMPSERHRPIRIITRQPQPQPRPSIPVRRVVGNRNAKGMPYAADGTRDWSTDLCHFCDHNLGTCCKALWCPCIVYGRNKARIEHLYAEQKVHPTRGGTCSDDCAIHGCLTMFCLFGWAIQVPNRASIRRRYNIEGDWIGDCAAALFCSPCELSQESREIDLEERSFDDQSIPSKVDLSA